MQEREQLDLFRALPGDMAPRDSQDLMAFPFFSLAKSRRTAPIDFRASGITIRVEGTAEHGIATIWDADVLIWAASQIVEARDAGLRPSRLMQATPYEILRFIGRGTSLRDYQRLKAALDRLQSTTVATSIRETTGDKGDNEKAPDFRLQAASHDIGAAWKKTSEAGREYISVTLDDPSFPATVYARLIEGEDGTHDLIWSRSKPQAA